MNKPIFEQIQKHQKIVFDLLKQNKIEELLEYCMFTVRPALKTMLRSPEQIDIDTRSLMVNILNTIKYIYLDKRNKFLESRGYVPEYSEKEIIPPDIVDIDIENGSGTFTKPGYVPRIELSFDALEQSGIHIEKGDWIIGKIKDFRMRGLSYEVIIIPELKKILFVCDEVGNRTFVAHTTEKGYEYYAEKTKEELKDDPDVTQLIWRKNRWIDILIQHLSNSPDAICLMQEKARKQIDDSAPENDQETKLKASDNNAVVEIDGEEWYVISRRTTRFEGDPYNLGGNTIIRKLETLGALWNGLHCKKNTVQLAESNNYVLVFRKSAVDEFLKNEQAQAADNTSMLEIEGDTWYVITQKTTTFQADYSLDGSAVMNRIKQKILSDPDWRMQNCKLRAARLGKDKNVYATAYRKSAIDELLGEKKKFVLLPDENSETVLENEIWCVVTYRTTRFQKKFKLSGSTVKVRLNAQSPEWHIEHCKEEYVKLPHASKMSDLYRLSEVLKVLEETTKHY